MNFFAHLGGPRAPSWRRTAVFLGLPLFVFMLLRPNGWLPFVRFNDDHINTPVEVLGCLLPFLSAAFAFFIPENWETKAAALLALTPLILLCAAGVFFYSVMTIATFQFGYDPSFRRIATVPMAGYSVSVFVDDCGVPCDRNIDVMQEIHVFPGVSLVRWLPGIDWADGATCKVLGANTIEVTTLPYADSNPEHPIPPRSEVYHLKRFLYF